jgi:hypothetical protein
MNEYSPHSTRNPFLFHVKRGEKVDCFRHRDESPFRVNTFLKRRKVLHLKISTSPMKGIHQLTTKTDPLAKLRRIVGFSFVSLRPAGDITLLS